MIIKDSQGKDIDTNTFGDLKALVYEEMQKLHDTLKPYGVSLMCVSKYKDDGSVVGSITLQEGTDFFLLLKYLDAQMKEMTDNQFNIKIVPNESN